MGSRLEKVLRFIIQTALIVGLYFLAAAGSKTITLQPENFTLVRLAPAFAVAAIYILGYQAIAGLFIGGMTFGLFHSFESGYLAAAADALLVSLPAAIIIFVSRRWIGSFPEKPTFRQLATFSLVVSVVVLITEVIHRAAAGLEYLGPGQFLIGYFTTCASTILIAPMLISLYETRQGRLSSGRSITLVVSLGIIFCLVLFTTIWNIETEIIKHQYTSDTGITASKIQSWVEEGHIQLAGYQGLFGSSVEVTQEEFFDYDRVQYKHFDYPGLLIVAWAPRVMDADRAAFEQTARQNVSGDFQIKEMNNSGQLVQAGRRQAYYPILFHISSSTETQISGFDLGSESQLLQMMEQAVSKHEPMATDILSLSGIPAVSNVSILFLPVFSSGSPGRESTPGVEQVLGFVVGVYHLPTLLDNRLTGLETTGQINLSLASAGGKSFYTWPPGALNDRQTHLITGSTGWKHDKQIHLHNQTWLLEVRPGPGYLADRRTVLPFVIMVLGLLFLYVVIYLMYKRQQITDVLVESQSRYQSLFDDSPLGIWEVDFSQIKTYLDQLQADGVDNLQSHFNQNPQDFSDCIKTLKLKAVNRSAMHLLGGINTAEIEAIVINWLGGSFADKTRYILAGLARGETRFQSEEKIHTPAGDKTILIEMTVVPPLQHTLERVLVSAMDITQVKQMELALQASEERYRVIFEGASEGIIAVDPETTRILYVNPATCKMFQYTPEEFLGRRLLDLHPEDVHPYALEQFNQALNLGMNNVQNMVCQRKNGSWFNLDISATKVLFDDKPVVVGFLQDVTEELLKDALLLARLHLSERVSRLDIVGLLQMILEEAENLTGSEISFIIPVDRDQKHTGRIIWSKKTLQLHPSFRDIESSQMGNLWLERLNQEQPLVWNGTDPPQMNWATPGNHPQMDCFMTTNIRQNDLVLAVCGVANKKNGYTTSDIEIFKQYAFFAWEIISRRQAEIALRESMEKYLVIFDSFPLGITITDSEGNIVEANRQSERFLGISQNEHTARQIDGEQWRVIRPDGSLMPASEFAAVIALQEKRLVENVEMGVERPDTSVKWLTVTAAPIPLENYGVAVTYSDITPRRQAEKALQDVMANLEKLVEERTGDLRQANQDLARAMHARDEFLANVSHELRTPLNGILGLSESLLEQIRGPLNPSQIRSLEAIEQSGRHLLALINDILDFSKIEAGRIEIHKDLVVARDACEASLIYIRDMARKKNIKISLVEETSDLQLAADPRRLKQILVNLLNNAVKFTPQGGNVTLRVNLDADGMVVFSIRDSGIGIPPESISRLFQPFTQLDSGLSRQYEGTGLGLALVKRLVEQHGGAITAESDGPGTGSTFTVRLPQMDEAVPDLLPLPKPEPPRPSENANATSNTIRPVILLAEDNETNVMAMADYLEYSGYLIQVARSGQEALDITRREKPDIILMDVQLPGMSGLEVIKSMRANPALAATPILAVTALVMPGDRERCLEAGANDYLTKPISMKILAATIRDWLAKPDSGNPGDLSAS